MHFDFITPKEEARDQIHCLNPPGEAGGAYFTPDPNLELRQAAVFSQLWSEGKHAWQRKTKAEEKTNGNPGNPSP